MQQLAVGADNLIHQLATDAMEGCGRNRLQRLSLVLVVALCPQTGTAVVYNILASVFHR